MANMSKQAKGEDYTKGPNRPFEGHWPTNPDTPYKTRVAIALRRFIPMTIKNYSTIPIVLISGAKLAWVVFFCGYRVRETPDLVYPHYNQEPWNRFEHLHTKLDWVWIDNTKVLENVRREHPRPRFEYKISHRERELRLGFPFSARYFWSGEEKPETKAVVSEVKSSEETAAKENDSEKSSSIAGNKLGDKSPKEPSKEPSKGPPKEPPKEPSKGPPKEPSKEPSKQK